MYKEIESNKRLSLVLIGVFVGIVVAAGWFFSYYYNNQFYLYVAVFISITQSWASYWYSDSISLAIAGAHEAPRKGEYLVLHRLVENVAIASGLPKPKVCIIEDEAPNAFATGRDPKHGAVAVTTGLLKILNKRELEGVIAHELSHIGNRDTLVMTITVVLVSIIALLSDMFFRLQWLGGRRRERDESGGIIALVGIVFLVLTPIIAKLVQLAVSRKREYMADATGALTTRFPEGLAEALEKISNSGKQLKNVSTATAHLYIANPFREKNFVTNLFSTHPPIEDRIKRLRNMGI